MTTLTAPMTRTASTSMTRWQVLAGALIVQLILGTIYGYSVYWQPLEERWYPPVLTEAEAAAQRAAGVTLDARTAVVADAAAAERLHAQRLGDLKYAFGICLLSFAGAMVFAGRLQDVRGPRFTATLGGILLAIGFLIAGQSARPVIYYLAHAVLMGIVAVALLSAQHALLRHVDRRSMPVLRYAPHGVITAVVIAGIVLGVTQVHAGLEERLLLLWATIGLIAGVGIGFAYVSPIAALVKWFPKHKGLVSGVAVAGFGFGAYLLSNRSAIGAVGFINHYGIDTFFSVHGLICLVAVCGGAMLLRNPPETASAAPGAKATAGDSTWRQTLRNPRFFVIWLMFFSGALAGLMVIGILKPFAGAQLVAAAETPGRVLSAAATKELLLKGAAAVGWLAIFNALGRVFWGWLSDKIHRTPAMTLMFLLQAGTLLSLAALHSDWTLAVGASCVGFNFGGNFALFPSLTADLFGSRNLGANYGWVFTSYGVAGVSGVALGNAAQTWTGSYFAAFAIAAGLCLASAVLAVILHIQLRRSARTA